MATDEAFSKALVEKTVDTTPHKTPQTMQGGGRRVKTGKKQEPSDSEIDTVIEGKRLDLSALGEAEDFPKAARLGLEPRTTEPESAVLPITPSGRMDRSGMILSSRLD